MSSSTHSTQTASLFYQELTEKIYGNSEKAVTSITAPDTTSPPFIKQELRTAIYTFNKNKAPGPDNIDHYILRNIYYQNPLLLLDMYNSLLRINYFPTDWKTGEIVYFLKTHKPPDDYNSYRPVTLLPTFGKVFKKCYLTEYIMSYKPQHNISCIAHNMVS